MSSIISQILKLKVRPSFTVESLDFKLLRESAASEGVKEQYYGLCTDEPNTLLWVISTYKYHFFIKQRVLPKLMLYIQTGLLTLGRPSKSKLNMGPRASEKR